jgi:hypothetical protein
MSPALFQVLLLVASIHLLQCGSIDLREVTFRRVATIQLVNEELRKKYRPVSDATIATVAYLAIIEVRIMNRFARDHIRYSCTSDCFCGSRSQKETLIVGKYI